MRWFDSVPMECWVGDAYWQWGSKFRREVYPIHVKMSETKAEISAVLGAFAALGFPGSMGSIDVVHVRWDKCPSNQTNLFTGTIWITTSLH